MNRMLVWAKTRWAQFKNDVWDDASIGPIAGILLSVLTVLIVWLTIEYAPGAAERAEQAASETKRGSDGVIRPFWGNVTVALMTIATLGAGFEPIIGRHIERWWRRTGKHWWKTLSRPTRWILSAPIAFIIVPAKITSCAWSLADYILARPVAILAGAAWRGWVWRYSHFVVLMLIVVGAVIATATGRFAPDFALAAIVVGLVAILAIVRRWSWIESDRDTFLIERGERQEGKGTLRIGFKEDLRDEALTALACLFFLIPLGLDLAQQATSDAGAPAFAFDGEESMPDEAWPRFIIWLGYFGAELTKTVPFVDWSEVFHVANGSPIEAQTALGSQLAFVLRAGLDLLLLAAVLQAIQIATRLREQQSAFRNNRLPILEPFSERVELARAYEQINDDLGIRPSVQPVVCDFPRYDITRLKELIDGTAGTRDIMVRRLSVALLQKVYEADPDGSSDTPRFWTKQAREEQDPRIRSYLLDTASGLDPDELDKLKDAARRARLLRLVQEDWNDARARTLAVRLLGRITLAGAERDVLMERLSCDKDMAVRAAAAVALAKSGVNDARSKICELPGGLNAASGDALDAMSTAFAMSLLGLTEDEVADYFRLDAHRNLVRAATRIQRAPMTPAAAKEREPGLEINQTVCLMPGCGPFPNDFDMGSAPGAPGSEPAEWPIRKHVKINRPFAIGRYAVTLSEYSMFAAATSRTHKAEPAPPRHPATWLSWHEANSYCAWLSAVTGEHYRLPTEAEWEYACRAGSNTSYSWGETWEDSKANSNLRKPNGRVEVGSYEPNEWGLWEMHGNVYEWCADPWHLNYSGTPPVDQSIWLDDGDFSLRVIRGGSGSSTPERLRSAFRYGDFPTFRYHYVGFRIARSISPNFAEPSVR